MVIDIKKIIGRVVGDILEHAQYLADAEPASAQAHREAGSISGLSEAVLVVSSSAGISYDEASSRLIAASQRRTLMADETESAMECRFHDAAASRLMELAEMALNSDFGGRPHVAEDAARARAEAPAASPQAEGRHECGKYKRRSPIVKVDDIVVWALSMRESGAKTFSVSDVAERFYSSNRSSSYALSAASKAVDAMVERGFAVPDASESGKNGKCHSFLLTEHGAFRAEKIGGPRVASPDTEEALKKRFAGITVDGCAEGGPQ